MPCVPQRVAPLLVPLAFCSALWAQTTPSSSAPFYTASSIVNAATARPGPIAPNGLVSLYGRNLAFATRAITADDIRGDTLPTALIGTGVRVLIGSIPVPILFVSPSQVNFIVPPNLSLGRHKLVLIFDSKSGPEVDFEVAAVSPGAFPLDPVFVIATHADGRLIDAPSPATPSQILILYASGLGQTTPRLVATAIARTAAPIERSSQLRILLDGSPLEPSQVLYAGLAPGFAGLYQINLRLPAELPENPELRIAIGDVLSPEGLHLRTRP